MSGTQQLYDLGQILGLLQASGSSSAYCMNSNTYFTVHWFKLSYVTYPSLAWAFGGVVKTLLGMLEFQDLPPDFGLQLFHVFGE